MSLSPKLEWKQILNDSPQRRRSLGDTLSSLSRSPTARFRGSFSQTLYSGPKKAGAGGRDHAFSCATSCDGTGTTLTIDLDAANPANTHVHDTVPQRLPLRRLLTDYLRARGRGAGPAGKTCAFTEVALRARPPDDEQSWTQNNAVATRVDAATSRSSSPLKQRLISGGSASSGSSSGQLRRRDVLLSADTVSDRAQLALIPDRYLDILPANLLAAGRSTAGGTSTSSSSSVLTASASGSQAATASALASVKMKHQKLNRARCSNLDEDFFPVPMGPNDWNSLHHEEGQSVLEFVARVAQRRGSKPTGTASTIYLLPCGSGSGSSGQAQTSFQLHSTQAAGGASSTLDLGELFGGGDEDPSRGSSEVDDVDVGAPSVSSSGGSFASTMRGRRSRSIAASTAKAGPRATATATTRFRASVERATASNRASTLSPDPGAAKRRASTGFGMNFSTTSKSTSDGQKLLQHLLHYCRAFFHPMDVKLLPYQRFEGIATRNVENDTGDLHGRQLHAGELLKKHLIPAMKMKDRRGSSLLIPADAYAVLAITSEDLYPCDDWPFVSGLSDTLHRVGVCSTARYEIVPDFSVVPQAPFNTAFLQTNSNSTLVATVVHSFCFFKLLKRMCRVITHELCHCFQMKHCVHFNCLMQGSKHFEEAEKKFFDLCPVCLSKLYFMLSSSEVVSSVGAGSTEQHVDVEERYTRLKRWVEKDVLGAAGGGAGAGGKQLVTTPAAVLGGPSGEACSHTYTIWSSRKGSANAAKQGTDADPRHQIFGEWARWWAKRIAVINAG